MELRQLRYFVRIVDLGSLSKAAADLFVAQPALSKQIAALEAELKATLLVRSPRGVTPTEAGQAFYRQAQSVLRQLGRIPDEVRSVQDRPPAWSRSACPSAPRISSRPRWWPQSASACPACAWRSRSKAAASSRGCSQAAAST
jgi:DNA-binding transcriptional LysR family regulator